MKYSEYDMQCIFMLGIEILKMLMLEECFIYIDMYYQAVKELYEDYKQYDNKNMSLLSNIHRYIENNDRKILERLYGIIDF